MRAGSAEAPLVFGYEEALGYAVTPSVARDKDGISAGAGRRAARRGAARPTAGRCSTGWTSWPASTACSPPASSSVRVEDLALIADAMDAAAGRPAGPAAGPRGRRATTCATDDPPVDAVRLLGDGVRVVVRPSGTEPKLKAYLETVVPVHDDAGIIAARGRGEDELDELRAEMSAVLGL